MQARQQILAADIGGTNARFALFSFGCGQLQAEKIAWRPSAGLVHTEDMLHAAEQALGVEPAAMDQLAIALAGPVQGLRGRLTNGTLELDFRQPCQGVRHVLLINDFLAQAHACLGPVGAAAVCMVQPEGQTEEQPERQADGLPGAQTAGTVPGQAAAQPLSSRAVLGAGTGLGAAMLAHTGREWLALPAELGHVAFSFVTEEEQAFGRYLCRRLQRSYALNDDVLSGRGLVALHHYLTGQDWSARDVGQRALQGPPGAESLTLQWFSRFYARLCRHWIVSTLCLGGLWIAGGIAAKNPLCIQSASFLEELFLMPDYESLLRSVPIYLMDDVNSGLWGVARAGALALQQGRGAAG